MPDRIKHFCTMVTPVACLGAVHRKVCKQDLYKMDIVLRRVLRSIIGPAGDVDWTLPWHARHGLKTWYAVCLGQYWRFASYVSTLPTERWVVRALYWLPQHARRVDRPAYTNKLQAQTNPGAAGI